MGKIPDHAKCVFKGVIFDVYQWEQELYDGTSTTFEMLKRRDTVVVIPLEGDQVYYARQEQPNKKPYVSLIGGRTEDNESPLDAAKRELLEETGLASNKWKQIRSFSLPGKIDWTVYYFVARGCEKISTQILDAGEKIEVSKMRLHDFVYNVIPSSDFSEHEIRSEIMSGFDTNNAEFLIKEILAA